MNDVNTVENSQTEYMKQDFDYVTGLLNAVVKNVKGRRLGGVNFSFTHGNDGLLRLSGAQCWFVEEQPNK